ncbi:hypothetical protein NUM3379_07420 [Kineococcus sp. NUM-3379]
MSTTVHAPAPSPPDAAGFPDDLAAAVALLRALPTARRRVEEARRQVRAWARQRPHLRAQLVVDAEPGTTEVGYDLLLEHPGGGTVALSAQVEDGVPWTVDHSTHWAAGQVLTVDGAGLSVATALYALRSTGARDPRLLEQLVDHRILLDEVAADEVPVTPEELQHAADEFRRRRGLHSRERFLAWTREMGLDDAALQDHLEVQARTARLRARFAGEPARRYLAEHPGEFRSAHVVVVTGHDGAALRELARLPAADLPGAALERQRGGAALGVSSRWVPLAELPEPLDPPVAGLVVGPVGIDGEPAVAAVTALTEPLADPLADLDRLPAPEAGRLLAAAADAAHRAWLASRRAAADVRWHWL